MFTVWRTLTSPGIVEVLTIYTNLASEHSYMAGHHLHECHFLKEDESLLISPDYLRKPGVRTFLYGKRKWNECLFFEELF